MVCLQRKGSRAQAFQRELIGQVLDCMAQKLKASPGSSVDSASAQLPPVLGDFTRFCRGVASQH
jgi:hypothetical protein